jgi:hypothetical protein
MTGGPFVVDAEDFKCFEQLLLSSLLVGLLWQG